MTIMEGLGSLGTWRFCVRHAEALFTLCFCLILNTVENVSTVYACYLVNWERVQEGVFSNQSLYLCRHGIVGCQARCQKLVFGLNYVSLKNVCVLGNVNLWASHAAWLTRKCTGLEIKGDYRLNPSKNNLVMSGYSKWSGLNVTYFLYHKVI